MSIRIPDDAIAILTECPAVSLVSPGVKSSVQAIYQNRNVPTQMQGGSNFR